MVSPIYHHITSRLAHQVFNLQSRSEETTPNLLIINISVPPSTPVIVEKQQGLVYGADVGPFEIGGSLIVTCKVFGGDKNYVKLG